MRVAVVTPRFREPREWFQQCLDSVRDQTYPCTHIVVNDGAERGPDNSDRVQVIDLPVSLGFIGDPARAIGSVSAVAQGFDAIAWLDADNWYSPNHIESLVKLHQDTGAAVLTSHRYLHRLDGGRLGPCPETDGTSFADTSTMLITREAFGVIPTWFLMEPKYHPIGDRMIWSYITDEGISHAHSGLMTLHYRTAWRFHYEHFGLEPPIQGLKESQWID